VRLFGSPEVGKVRATALSSMDRGSETGGGSEHHPMVDPYGGWDSVPARVSSEVLP